ncbi:MAG: hypothetical protein LW817_02765 [Candidatus Caenarcaniphilales bacterium]|jgi:hypothetical protein|nr:hypothetical protein [Candidatus Caenarcaniphilales bacterium]
MTYPVNRNLIVPYKHVTLKSQFGQKAQNKQITSLSYPPSIQLNLATQTKIIQGQDLGKIFNKTRETLEKIAYDLNKPDIQNVITKIKANVDNYIMTRNPVELRDAEESLKKLETDFSKAFKDPSDELGYHKDLEGVDKSLSDFCKKLRRLALARRIETYYNISGKSTKESNSNIEIKAGGESRVTVTKPIESELIFRQSRELHDIESTEKDDLINESKQQLPKFFTDAMPKLIRSFFPRSEEGRLMPRQDGLKEACLLHFTLLKNFEPELYELTFKLAKELSQGSISNKEKPIMLIPFAAYQGEERLATEMLPALARQKIDLSKCPIYIFINGQSPAAISKLATNVQEASSSLSLRTNIIEGVPEKWGMGLKSIPVNTAIMAEVLSTRLNEDDSDIPIVLFDSDILGFKNDNALSDRKAISDSGTAIFTGLYQNDSTTMINSNVNYFLIDRLAHRQFSLVISNYDMKTEEQSTDAQKKEQMMPDVLGGNSMYSTILYCLFGGIKSHSVNEDQDFSNLVVGQTYKIFEIENKTDAEKNNLFHDATEHDYVVCDGGAITRTVDKNLPITMMFQTHDHNSSSSNIRLNAIDAEKAQEINSTRIIEEIEIILLNAIARSNQFINNNVNNSNRDAATNEIFARKLEKFSELFNAEIEAALPGEKTTKLKLEPINQDASKIPQIRISFNGQERIFDFDLIKEKYKEG